MKHTLENIPCTSLECVVHEEGKVCSSFENDNSFVEQQEQYELDEGTRISKCLELKHNPFEGPEIITDLQMVEGIASYLEGVPELRYENWSRLSLEQRKQVLNELEKNIAQIEHRPALTVDVELMKPKTLGYQSASQQKIALNSMYVNSNSPEIHREVIDTIIHEGRHAYQHYNVDVKLIHESVSEVKSWEENFYDPQYKYYQSTGQLILIPFNDGKIHNVDYRLYYYQPVEIDARNFASNIMKRLEDRGIVAKFVG